MAESAQYNTAVLYDPVLQAVLYDFLMLLGFAWRMCDGLCTSMRGPDLLARVSFVAACLVFCLGADGVVGTIHAADVHCM